MILVAALLGALMACGGGAHESPPAELPRADPQLETTSVESVEALRDAEGVFEIDAWVMRIPSCPPCEGPEPCEPCGPLGLEISDTPEIPPIPSDSDIHIDPFSADVSAFESGRRYRFVIQAERLEGQPRSYLKLLGAEMMR